MIEKFQPITRYDINLARRILAKNDELVIGIGNAGHSHDFRQVMTAGERIGLIDFVLKEEGLNPNRYTLIPIEDMAENYRWVAETRMLTPRWQKVYTRNFKNASMFESYESMGYETVTLNKQKPRGNNREECDYFAVIADIINGKAKWKDVERFVPESALHYMNETGIISRIDVIYNRNQPRIIGNTTRDKTLFLGGFQPFTGVYKDTSGHASMVKKGLEHSSQVVIAIGSGQHSDSEYDPLTAGQRIEIIRYVLQKNGVDASKFYTIPIKNIDANFPFGNKVMTMCPAFDTVIAGNDWTKRYYSDGNFNVIGVERAPVKGGVISGTRVRKNVRKAIRDTIGKEDKIEEKTIRAIAENLDSLVDPAALEIFPQIGFYDIMHFLEFAKE